MESHPVPQNVTSFEFHLIGDMTLKQFAYLASGAVTAYLTYFLIFPYLPLIAIPIMVVSSSLGVLFAFVPIADRPLDHWVLAFFKAVYSPTKRIWQGQKTPQFTNRLNIYLASVGAAPLPEVVSQQPLSRLLTATQENVRASAPVIPAPILTRITPLVAPPAPPQQSALGQQQMASSLQPVASSQLPVANQLQPISKPPVVMPSSPQVNGPNIIAGTILDPSGNPLDQVIIVIHNAENLPVRALKTGKNGQFTGATPLPGGLYQLELEKEGSEFSPIQVELKGELLTPLVIQAKEGGG